MREPSYESSPSDHHLQAQILETLFTASQPVAFGMLKPDTIDNSLFAYHLQKLTRRGLVTKQPHGYILTTTGTRWVNFTNPSRMRPRRIPRLLIQLIIVSPDHQYVLISQRNGAASHHLAPYLLPSGFALYDTPLHEAALHLLHTFTPQSTELRFVGTLEYIHHYPDGYVHHVVAPTFCGTLTRDAPLTMDHYTPRWVSVTDILAANSPYGMTIRRALRYWLGELDSSDITTVEHLQ